MILSSITSINKDSSQISVPVVIKPGSHFPELPAMHREVIRDLNQAVHVQHSHMEFSSH